MNRAGHRHQQWHARTEQQQQVVVNAPGDICGMSSTIGEGRAAEPSPGSISTVSSTPDSIVNSVAGSTFFLLGLGMPSPQGRGIFTCGTPRAQGMHGRRQQNRPCSGEGLSPPDGAGGSRHTCAQSREQGTARSSSSGAGGRNAARNADREKSFPGGPIKPPISSRPRRRRVAAS